MRGCDELQAVRAASKSVADKVGEPSTQGKGAT